jgi:hypothetical protein
MAPLSLPNRAPIAGIDHLVVEHDAPAALVKALGAAGPAVLSANA